MHMWYRIALVLCVCACLASRDLPAASSSLPALVPAGTRWADAEGRIVTLRGVNLGNWLIQEMWMHNMGLEGVPDQYTLENTLAARFGDAAKNALMEAYRANYLTARDFDVIASFGMNVVRLPFLYTLLVDDARPYELKPDAWTYLDWAIDTAEAHGIYTIVDLHGAPGCQSDMHHTGREGFNRLFFESQYQDRTVWLWEKVAERYRDRTAVAAYDILNEAWGSSREALEALALRIYHAIRAVDPNHIVVLPSYWDGFEFYGDLEALGLVRVANAMHFYPGIFDGRENTVATHRDWLTSGVLNWRDRVGAQRVPFLVGEMNVVARAAGGGEMMRHSFDTYGALRWATTMWSYKVFSSGGGIGSGTWGMVTNMPGAGAPRVKADTWNCMRWDCTFADACAYDFTTYLAPGTGPVNVYLLLKAGACCGGSVDVVFDKVSLIDESNGAELVVNGDFGSAAGWSSWSHAGTLQRSFTYTAATPAGGSGPALRFWGADYCNGGVYQRLTLQGGRMYRLGGIFRDLGSTPDAAWAEVYLRTDAPVPGVDYKAGAIPGADIDITTSSYAQILAYFESLSRMDYAFYDDLRYWLTTDESPALFTPLRIADWYAFGSHDSWQLPGTEMAETSPGSRLYRRRVSFGAGPVLEWWKALRTDYSEEYPGPHGVDSWVKHRSGGIIDLLMDETPQGDGWLPDAHFLYQQPTYIAGTYVAVGDFQAALGDSNWNAQSAITVMSDDGATRGDQVAGDKIYTLRVVIPAAGTYRFTGVLVDRSWQTRITGISASGDTSGGEFPFTTVTANQPVRFLCDVVRNRVKVEVLPVELGGLRRPGDVNQDRGLDIGDAVWLLGHLFGGNGSRLPCEGTSAAAPGRGDLALADVNGDGRIDIADPVRLLAHLFAAGAPPVLGTGCVRIVGCSDRCGP